MLTKDFILAGKAVFTVDNGTTHYTFKVKHNPQTEQWVESWFIYLLTGPDNTKDFTYMGLLKPTGEIITTQKSKFTPDSLPLKVARWGIGMIWNQKPIPDGYSIRHEGRCGRCGRVLTHPESIASGLGPECEGRARRSNNREEVAASS